MLKVYRHGKTVGLPLGIAAKLLLLQGKLQETVYISRYIIHIHAGFTGIAATRHCISRNRLIPLRKHIMLRAARQNGLYILCRQAEPVLQYRGIDRAEIALHRYIIALH